jgi:hypothetical protein
VFVGERKTRGPESAADRICREKVRRGHERKHTWPREEELHGERKASMATREKHETAKLQGLHFSTRKAGIARPG